MPTKISLEEIASAYNPLINHKINSGDRDATSIQLYVDTSRGSKVLVLAEAVLWIGPLGSQPKRKKIDFMSESDIGVIDYDSQIMPAALAFWKDVNGYSDTRTFAEMLSDANEKLGGKLFEKMVLIDPVTLLPITKT